MCTYIYTQTHTDIYTYIFNTHIYEIYTPFLGTKERLSYFNIITKTFPFIFLFIFNKKFTSNQQIIAKHSYKLSINSLNRYLLGTLFTKKIHGNHNSLYYGSNVGKIFERDITKGKNPGYYRITDLEF